MLHVQTWECGSVRLTEMNNAGKRGKVCRVLRFIGWRPCGGDETARRAAAFAFDVLQWAKDRAGALEFDAARAQLEAMVAAAELPAHAASVNVEEIRGVDAPREVLTAGVDGKWAASVDVNGVSVSDLEDRNNEPAMITTRQTGAAAYAAAARVWAQVQACGTFYQVGEVLRAAGCRLHSYCRMD